MFTINITGNRTKEELCGFTEQAIPINYLHIYPKVLTGILRTNRRRFRFIFTVLHILLCFISVAHLNCLEKSENKIFNVILIIFYYNQV